MHQHEEHNHYDSASQRIGWAFALNFGFTFVELIGGLLTNSTAIIADAVHDLGDCLAIGTAWLLNRLSTKQANENYSYGFRRFSLLGALINSLVLIVGSVWILIEAIPRLWQPQMPLASGMVVLAIFGVVVNGYAAFKLSKGKTLNEKVLNWHLLEDVFGWVAVLIVAVILLFFDLPLLDPILSIGFTLFILINVIKNLIETTKLFLQATPDTSTREQILATLSSLDYVQEVHHLHLWSLDGEHHVLTAHLVLEKEVDHATQVDIKKQIALHLQRYDLAHTTIEFELPDEFCRDTT